MTNTTMTVTLSVLGGAYKGKRASLKVTLTHAVDVEADGATGEIAICGQQNMADVYSSSDAEKALAPTCPKCQAKLRRRAGTIAAR